jgi:DNA-binding NarL/FixJ family response regulator
MTINTLVSDNRDVVRQGLRMYLGLDPELEVVEAATNGQETFGWLAGLGPTWC